MGVVKHENSTANEATTQSSTSDSSTGASSGRGSMPWRSQAKVRNTTVIATTTSTTTAYRPSTLPSTKPCRLTGLDTTVYTVRRSISLDTRARPRNTDTSTPK